MSADQETTRMVRSWLRTDEHESADHLLKFVLARLDATPQRRSSWSLRRLAQMNRLRLALSAAAIVVVVLGVAGLNLLPRLGGVGPGASGLTSSPSPSEALPATVRPAAEVDPFYADYTLGRHAVTVDDIRFSVAIPGRGWEPRGPRGTAHPPIDNPARLSINRSYHGPQGAEAMLYWTSPFGALYTDPCQQVLDGPVGSIADLAAAVASAPGVDLLSGPTDVTLGGLPAKRVVVTVREDLGCDPGYFYTWDEFPGGALWTRMMPGDTIRIWIVEVHGLRLFIAAETHADAPAAAGSDLEEIVNSIQFE